MLLQPHKTGIAPADLDGLTSDIRIGDSTDYILMDYSERKIVYGGTMRPTLIIDLLQNLVHEYVGAPSPITVGDNLFQHLRVSNNDYLDSVGIPVDRRWDISANGTITMKVLLGSASSTTDTSTDIAVMACSVRRLRAGSTMNPGTQIIVETAKTVDFGTGAAYILREFTLDTAAGNTVALGDKLACRLQRMGSHGSNTVTGNVAVAAWWLEIQQAAG